MRIVIATPDLPPDGGGIGTYTDLLARGILECGDEVVVLKGDQGSATNHYVYPYEVVRLQKGNLIGAKTLENVGKLRNEVKRRRVDALLCTNWNTFGLESFILWKLAQVPYLVVVHCMELLMGGRGGRSQFKKKLMVRILLGARRIIAVSRYTKNLLILLGIPAERIEVVHNGVDVRKLVPGKRREALAEKLGISHKKVILTVSRIEQYKGIGKVLEVMRDVESMVHGVVYIVVGEGSAKADLERQASDLGISESVIFTGRVSDEELLDYYGLADLFVLPSIEKWTEDKRELLSAEGFGLVLAEASSCGKPVIAGESGGTREVVEDGVTGFLIDTHDRDELLGSIVSVLTDHSLAERLGEAGRRKAERDFDTREKVERVRELIMENL
jgi:phosphatidylinositol alpha-1,6-mannosyltransferase